MNQERARARRPFSLATGPGKGIFVAAVAALIVIGGSSLNRAWTQVRSLEVEVPPGAIRAGWTPRISVTTSGRTPVTVYVTIEQEGHADTISVHRVGAHRYGLWDPRFISRTFAPRLGPSQAARLVEGRATLRAEARGVPHWLHESTAVLRDIPILVAAQP